MDATDQARLEQLHEQQLSALKPQGKRPKTIEAYARAVRRVLSTRPRRPQQNGQIGSPEKKQLSLPS